MSELKGITFMEVELKDRMEETIKALRLDGADAEELVRSMCSALYMAGMNRGLEMTKEIINKTLNHKHE